MKGIQKPLYFQSNGEEIAGTLHLPAGRGRCGGVAMVHGFRGQRCGARFMLVELSRRLADAGMASLRFDCRGCGESAGRFEDMTPGGQLRDAAAALGELGAIRRVDASRLGLVGISLGGMIAALLAASDRRVKAAVLVSPVARADEMADGMLAEGMRAMLERDGRVDIGGLYLSKAFFDGIEGLDGPSRIAESPAALLVISGSDDETVPPGHADEYFERARARQARTERLVVPGADHTYSSVPWREAALSGAVDFLKGTLGSGARLL